MIFAPPNPIKSSPRKFFVNPIRFLLGNPQLTFDDIKTPELAKPEVKPVHENLKPRDKMAAELRKQANELEKEILQEIQNYKPKGKMSEFAEVMMGAGMTSPYKNDEIVSTPFGTIVFAKARSPDKKTAASWDEKYKKSEELRGKALQYSFSLVPKPHITTGNYRVVEQGKRLHEQGLLTPEEIRELEKLEKFWQDHPELDRQKDVGMWNENLELVPWKSGIGKPEAKPIEEVHKYLEEKGIKPEPEKPASSWRKFPDHKSETKAVKEALKKAGIEAEVGHGTGTAWGWLEINIGDPGLRNGLKPAPFGSQYTDEELALHNKVLKIAQVVTGRHGDYDGMISLSAQGWRHKVRPFKEKPVEAAKPEPEVKSEPKETVKPVVQDRRLAQKLADITGMPVALLPAQESVQKPRKAPETRRGIKPEKPVKIKPRSKSVIRRVPPNGIIELTEKDLRAGKIILRW